jgi:hypothetical protein
MHLACCVKGMAMTLVRTDRYIIFITKDVQNFMTGTIGVFYFLFPL